MIVGTHTVIFSTDPEADRAFFRDVIKIPYVDSGDGWLIFALPPSELAVHPAESNDVHKIYLLSDNIEGFMAEMAESGIDCSSLEEEDWGRLTTITLPGGGKVGAYEPKHARPEPFAAS